MQKCAPDAKAVPTCCTLGNDGEHNGNHVCKSGRLLLGAHRRNSRRPPSAFLHAGFLSLASPADRPWRRGLTRGSNHCNLWTKHSRAFSARFNIMVDIPSQARTDRRPHRTEDASRSKPVAGNLQLRHQHVRMTSAKRLCDRYDYASPLVSAVYKEAVLGCKCAVCFS